MFCRGGKKRELETIIKNTDQNYYLCFKGQESSPIKNKGVEEKGEKGDMERMRKEKKETEN